MIKRFFSSVLVVVMLLSLFSVETLAVNHEVALTVEQVTAAPGESVKVGISIANNTGICGATISVAYDKKLTLTDVEEGSAFSTLTMTKPGRYSANPINILWDGLEDDLSNGDIAWLTFTAPEESGSYPISVSYVSGNVLDGNLQPVELNIINGGILVSEGPEILTQPEDYAGPAGGTATFRVTASGAGLTYQWQYQKEGAKEWKDSSMDGNRTGTLHVPIITLRDGQLYRCVICDETGKKLISDPAKIVVTESAKNPYTDVKNTDYFADAVLWAYEGNITSGSDATHFDPQKACTRGQVVTFLWRAKGCPEPTSNRNPFVDVSANAYYFKAVLWAYENKITQGIDATHFAPDKTVTRGQVVTFLWRAQGEPQVSASTNPFEDVPMSSYALQAVLWAKSEGITTGVDSAHFGTNTSCTRGQVVTFLYRTVGE